MNGFNQAWPLQTVTMFGSLKLIFSMINFFYSCNLIFEVRGNIFLQHFMSFIQLEDEQFEIYNEYLVLVLSSHLWADLPSQILDHYYGNTYMIIKNVDGSYWEKLESPTEELKHLTCDLITKLTPLHFQQV